MKHLLRILLVTFFGGFVTAIYAQEGAPSLPYSNPSLINPALTGVFEGVWRFNSTYRVRQVTEGTRFQTASALLERAVRESKLINGGIGINLQQDNSAGFVNTQFLVNVAYDFPLGNKIRYTHLRAGLQAGLLQRSISTTGLTFQDQFDAFSSSFIPGGSVDPANNGIATPIRVNAAAGLMLFSGQKIKGNQELNYFIGASLQNLTRPDIGLLGASQPLPFRWVYNAGFKFRTRSATDFNLNAVYINFNNSNSVTYQAFVRLVFFEKNILHGTEKTSLMFGATLRQQLNDVTSGNNTVRFQGLETFSPFVGAEISKSFTIAGAYDLLISRQTPNTSTFGGFQFMFSYVFGYQKVKKYPALPLPLF
jgi:type IX secretion system PorP/SprF family membrane protein